ncbi:MAG TPA: membrane protein insertion efficiency factor YidD [Gammaproteobacteria bacterium]|nr:membrane protein insertion efficiency factor YidD [Gammaproteobacteria bacterium]
MLFHSASLHNVHEYFATSGARPTENALGLHTRLAIRLVLAYRRIAPAQIRGSCRFEPTCSEFAIQALCYWGFWRGWRLIFRRLTFCRPPWEGKHEVPSTFQDYTKFLSLRFPETADVWRDRHAQQKIRS